MSEGVGRKELRFRLVIFIGLFIFCVILVLIGVATAIILWPKAPFVTIVSNPENTKFEVSYCPSPSDETCCPSPDSCQFQIRNRSQMNVEHILTLSISHMNIVPIYADSIGAKIYLGSNEVATGAVQNVGINGLGHLTLNVSINFDRTLFPNSLMRDIMCSINSDSRQIVPYALSLDIQGFRVMLTYFTFSEDRISAPISYQRSCGTHPEQCMLSSFFKDIICNP